MAKFITLTQYRSKSERNKITVNVDHLVRFESAASQSDKDLTFVYLSNPNIGAKVIETPEAILKMIFD